MCQPPEGDQLQNKGEKGQEKAKEKKKKQATGGDGRQYSLMESEDGGLHHRSELGQHQRSGDEC
jgi:hypothetical protein